jgi:dienelactone hydrolase
MKTLIEPDLDSRTLVTIPVSGGEVLEGNLNIPAGAAGLVIFAHGSGSSRHSRRNISVADTIRDAGIGTLLFDLLTLNEEREDAEGGFLRFNIPLLAHRLACATRWIEQQPGTRELKIGFFGSSTGGAAALLAAAGLGDRISTVVSRGGRPDLAGDALQKVRCPTLLLVGGLDDMVIRLNEEALAKLTCDKELRIVPGASHLFEEPGKLEQVAWISAQWFAKYLGTTSG